MRPPAPTAAAAAAAAVNGAPLSSANPMNNLNGIIISQHFAVSLGNSSNIFAYQKSESTCKDAAN